jgi:hypothetical protein
VFVAQYYTILNENKRKKVPSASVIVVFLQQLCATAAYIDTQQCIELNRLNVTSSKGFLIIFITFCDFAKSQLILN